MFFSSRGDHAPAVTRPMAASPAGAPPLPVHRPEVVERAFVRHRLALDLDPDEFAVDALLGEPSERLLPDEILCLVELDVLAPSR